MQSIQAHISRKQQEIATHEFLAQFRPDPSRERELWFVPLTAFWAMAFQDVVRMNADRVDDPELRRILHQNRIEELRHDEWYLADLRSLGYDQIDLAWLYGPQCRLVREATFALASEVFFLKQDVLRLILVFTLEAASEVFFGKVVAALQQSEHGRGLRYFAASHIEVEKAHDLFTNEVQSRVQNITLSTATHEEAIALVDRAFAAFRLMADGFVQSR